MKDHLANLGEMHGRYDQSPSRRWLFRPRLPLQINRYPNFSRCIGTEITRLGSNPELMTLPQGGLLLLLLLFLLLLSLLLLLLLLLLRILGLKQHLYRSLRTDITRNAFIWSKIVLNILIYM